MSRDSIAELPMRELTRYGIAVPDYASDHEAIVWKFAASKKQYVFCAYDDAVPSWMADVDEPIWGLSAFKVYVVEMPTQLVLEDTVIYRGGDVDLYRFDHLDALRPGEWLMSLYKTEDAIKSESDKQYEAFSKRFDAERAKKFT